MSLLAIYGNIVTEDSLLESHYLTIDNGVVKSISKAEPSAEYERIETGDDCLILPGFRDPHTHDVNGQVASKDMSTEEIAERFGTVMRAYAANGVTAVYVATFGVPLEELEHYCRGAKRWLDYSRNGNDGTRLLGINIEGSFINDECRGAQSAEYCFIPTQMDCVKAVNRLSETGAVRMMNIVPDYGEPSLLTIKHARNKGLMVGSGHLKPEARLLHRAYNECGLQYMVHFTNGPTGQSFKPFGNGNAFEGAMTIPIRKELILDLIHVDGRYVLDMIRRNEERWGDDNIIAITDGMFPVDEELPQEEFQIGTTVAVQDQEMNCLRATAYLKPDGTRVLAPPNTLCGSILKMNQAFANLMRLFTQDIEGIWYHHPAMPVERALVKTAKLCALNQANLDRHETSHGSLMPGKRADITIGKLNQTNNRYELFIQKTLIDGHIVYSA